MAGVELWAARAAMFLFKKIAPAARRLLDQLNEVDALDGSVGSGGIG
jgi:hypothetical protein